MPNTETKNALLGYFWTRVFKNYCHIWNKQPQTCTIAIFRKKKQNCINFGPKIPYLVIFGVEFENTVAIFEIRTLKFVKLQNFAKIQNYINLETKVPYLGNFKVNFENNYCHIWNQHPHICEIAKFCKNTNLLKLGPKIRYLDVFQVEF